MYHRRRIASALVILVAHCGGETAAGTEVRVLGNAFAADPADEELYVGNSDGDTLRNLSTGSSRLLAEPPRATVFRHRRLVGRYSVVDVDTGEKQTFGPGIPSLVRATLDPRGIVYYSTLEGSTATVKRLDADGTSSLLASVPMPTLDKGPLPLAVDDTFVYVDATTRVAKAGGPLETYALPGPRCFDLVLSGAEVVCSAPREEVDLGGGRYEEHHDLIAMSKAGPASAPRTVLSTNRHIVGLVADDTYVYWCEARAVGRQNPRSPAAFDQYTDFAVKKVALRGGGAPSVLYDGECGAGSDGDGTRPVGLSKSFVVWASGGKLKWVPR